MILPFSLNNQQCLWKLKCLLERLLNVILIGIPYDMFPLQIYYAAKRLKKKYVNVFKPSMTVEKCRINR